MATEINGESKDGSHIVGASNGPEDYFLWQKDEKFSGKDEVYFEWNDQSNCLLYTSPSPRDLSTSRMPSSA